jgi:hypothetical protein
MVLPLYAPIARDPPIRGKLPGVYIMRLVFVPAEQLPQQGKDVGRFNRQPLTSRLLALD